jgi:hypothetical protein
MTFNIDSLCAIVKELRLKIKGLEEKNELLKHENSELKIKVSSCSLCTFSQSIKQTNQHNCFSYFTHTKMKNLEKRIRNGFKGLNSELEKIDLK